jgi:hypothetical protein
MSDDASLRKQARELLESGRLPSRRPNRIWGGPVFGMSPCMVCGAPAKRGEVVLEVEFGHDGSTTNPHFHVRCFAALEAELRSFGSGEPSSRGDGKAAASAAKDLRRRDGA